MTEGERLAAAAASLIGVPFRLYGRDPATGLDCIGLAVCCLSQIGYQVEAPAGYRLRNASIGHWLHLAERASLRPASGEILTGDVILTKPGPAQNHLAIAEGDHSIIHAHAGLRRVVRQPLFSNLTLVARWRLPLPAKDN